MNLCAVFTVMGVITRSSSINAINAINIMIGIIVVDEYCHTIVTMYD